MAGAATGGVTAEPQTPQGQLPSGLTGPQFGFRTPRAMSATMQSPVMNVPGSGAGQTQGSAQGGGIAGLPVNPMQQASLAQQGALAGTVGAGLTNIGTIAGSDIASYQNPYTQQVIDATQADILRGAQQGINALDYQAGRAGAFGGSRHGVALGELGTGVAQQLAQTSAGLRQAGFQNAQQMAQSDIQNRLAQANLGLGSAAQLGALGQQSFGYGTAIQGQLAAQGQQQQAMEQALIDAAKAQYAGYTGAPQQSLGYVSAALGATPVPETTTQTKQPGLFDYLTLAASAAPSDETLKTDVKLVGKLKNGIELFTWKWNQKAKDLGITGETRGVMAQRIQKIIPEAVLKHADGYLMVDYSHPELSGAR